ncbi:hypothetical protein TL16_g06635 [Triparma laevis f. inornata]|uniref:PDZ domain-containing protein n=1 Tax=Triparma laevis f. inornata TaxID=1714386 RepID=A0A9W7ATZ1_9STRA|nr:hypothetical protein TL16_g06635 [Triparma laevis f. inornata]
MPFSDSEYSDSTDSTAYSGSMSDLDETTHHGQAGSSMHRGQQFESYGIDRGEEEDCDRAEFSTVKRVGKKKSSSPELYPEPTYNVVLASNIKFLGINLDMNRVFGKRVIEVRGAALKAGVQEGDLLVEVNGVIIKGQIDIKSLFTKDFDGFNSFRFLRTEVLRSMKTSRLRKVFPVASTEELTVLINEVELREGDKEKGNFDPSTSRPSLIVEIEPEERDGKEYFSTLLDKEGEVIGDTKEYATWGGRFGYPNTYNLH